MNIKTKVAGALLLAVLVMPGISFAQTQSVASLQQEVTQLLAQIAQLQAQLSAQNGSSAPSSSAGAGWCYTFNANLSTGMQGTAITALQTALQNDGETVTVTGTYDAQTVAAVTAFQQKYASVTLTPYGLTKGTGFVGTSTRTELDVLFGCATSGTPVNPAPLNPVDQALTITNLSPSTAATGTTVTINGTDFGSTNTVLMNGDTAAAAVSSNGTSLTFVVPSQISPPCSGNCPQPLKVMPGTYNVSVETGGITSNVLPLTVKAISPVCTGTCATVSISGITTGQAVVAGQPISFSYTIGSAGSSDVQFILIPQAGTTIRTGNGTAYIQQYGGYNLGGTSPVTNGTHSASITIPSDIPAGTYKMEVQILPGGAIAQGPLTILAEVASNQFSVTASIGPVCFGTCTNAPSITKLSPNPAVVGATVTVFGYGFGPTSTVLMNGRAVATNLASTGGTLTFTIPAVLVPTCTGEACPQATPVLPGTSYSVTVQSNGQTSNAITFTTLSPVCRGSCSTTILNVTATPGFSGSTVVPGAPSQEIGSYTVSALSTEGVNVSSVTINAGSNAGNFFQNLKLYVNGVQFGTTQAIVQNNGTYVFSGSPVMIPAGASINAVLFADILSSPQAAAGSVLTDATSFTACSATGAVSYSAYSCYSVPGQTMTLGSAAAPQISVNPSGNTPPAGQVTMGTTGNVLGFFIMTNTDAAEAVKVNSISFEDMTAIAGGSKAAFGNLQLWNGATFLGTAGAPTTNSSNNGYVYTMILGNPLVIPANGSVAVSLKGDVASFASGAATDGSTHTFGVIAVAGAGAISNIVSSANTANAWANAVTIYRTSLAFIGLPVINTPPLSFQQLGSFTLTSNQAGDAVPNALTLTFGGNGISAALLQSIVLRDANGTSLAPSSVNTTNDTVTWQFPSYYDIVAGSSYSFTVWGDLSKINGGTNVAPTITASVRATGDFSYYDGANGNPILVILTSVQVPVSVVSLTFPPGSGSPATADISATGIQDVLNYLESLLKSL